MVVERGESMVRIDSSKTMSLLNHMLGKIGVTLRITS